MTGQYPKRRETDAEAKERVRGLEERAKRFRPFRVPRGVWLSRLPHITASGRLVRP
jgi:hypothetical protein